MKNTFDFSIALYYRHAPESDIEKSLPEQGYAYYYNSIIFLKTNDKKKAQEELNKGIKALESIKTKNSEDYALLSMLYSFSCQFLGFPDVIKASKQATNCIDKSLKLDENNLIIGKYRIEKIIESPLLGTGLSINKEFGRFKSENCGGC